MLIKSSLGERFSTNIEKVPTGSCLILNQIVGPSSLVLSTLTDSNCPGFQTGSSSQAYFHGGEGYQW